MAGVKGWYSAIGWNQPGIECSGTNALEISGSRISGSAALLAASALGLPRPMPTAIQVRASEKNTSRPNAASHSSTFASCERNPIATPTAPTSTTLATDCSTLPATRPSSTEPRWIAMVRNRATMPSFMSVAIDTAVPTTVEPMVISRMPGTR